MARLWIFLVRTPSRSLAFVALLLLGAPAVIGAASDPATPSPAADSPFLPPAEAATGQPGLSPDAYALVGMTVVGRDTLLSLTRQSDKRSFWIPVGKTVNGVTAVSYDSRADRAVIRADGHSFTLILRKADAVDHPAVAPAPAASPSAAVAPSAAAAPPPGVLANRPMTVLEEKEMEARMLVTDLLEIGQQQRKAYEEAQRLAAARAKAAPSPAADAPPAAPAPPVQPPAK